MGEISESLNINTGELEGKLRQVDQQAKKTESDLAAAQRAADTKLKATINRIREASESANKISGQLGDIALKGAKKGLKQLGGSLAPMLESELGLPGLGHGILEIGKHFSEGATEGLIGAAGGALIAGAFLLKEVFDEYRRGEDERFNAMRSHLIQFERRQEQLELEQDRERIQRERQERRDREQAQLEAEIDTRDKIEEERLAYVRDFGDY